MLGIEETTYRIYEPTLIEENSQTEEHRMKNTQRASYRGRPEKAQRMCSCVCRGVSGTESKF